VHDDSDEIDAKKIAETMSAEVWMVPPMVAASGACVDLIEMVREHPADLNAARVQDILLQHGVLVRRAPTSDELADPDWWGHAANVKAGEEQIIEMEDDFGNMLGIVSQVMEATPEAAE